MPQISHSGLNRFNKCPYSYKLRYIDKIKPSESIYTAFGHSIHSTCENILLKKINQPEEIKSFFKNDFQNELRSLETEYLQKVFFPKNKDDERHLPIVKDMMRKGAYLSNLAVKKLYEKFKEFDIIGIEYEIKEDIVDFKTKQDFVFKGIIDLIIKDKNEKYYIIDWKSTSWGWLPQKKTNKMITYQLTYYKYFYTLQNNIVLKDVNTYFALIKRTAFKKNNTIPKENVIEFINVSTGTRKIKNSLNLLSNTLYNIENENFVKNKLSCENCEYYRKGCDG